MQERRKFVRLNTSVDVKWAKITQESKGVLSDLSVSKNISGGGICLTVYGRSVDIGDLVYMEIDLPAKEIIKVKGRVAWIGEFEIVGGRYEKRYDLGIEFLEIKEKDRGEIDQFVFSIASKKSGGQ